MHTNSCGRRNPSNSRDDVEVPQVALADVVPATPWRPHRSDVLQVLQPAQGKLLAVVPGAVVNGLAQQLNWRLRTVLLHLLTASAAAPCVTQAAWTVLQNRQVQVHSAVTHHSGVAQGHSAAGNCAS